MEYLLGVDLGTSGTKTVLFDVNGQAIASETIEYPLHQPQNGWAEQAPEDWWDAARTTIRSVIEQSGVDAADIKGLGISGQMHGLVLLDADGNVLREAIKSMELMGMVQACAGRGTEIPLHLRSPQFKGYKYPHDYENDYVDQSYLPTDLSDRHYSPFGNNKTEQAAKAYWDKIKNL